MDFFRQQYLDFCNNNDLSTYNTGLQNSYCVISSNTYKKDNRLHSSWFLIDLRLFELCFYLHRYFNSVAPSRSWCGEESYFGGKSNSKLRKNKYKKKLRSNSSSSQYLKSSQPTLELAIRNNSIAGYQFDTM